jgi:predicted phosphoadenosine phosphosulfate sulfurtransferase
LLWVSGNCSRLLLEKRRIEMGKCTVIDEFEGEFKGFSYTGEVFWDKENKRSFCKIYPQGLDHSTIQRDTYTQAIWEVEKLINDHLEESKKEEAQTFVLIGIGSEDAYEISEYYQDLEEFSETDWVSSWDDTCVMQEFYPGIWYFDDKWYVAIKADKGLYNKPISEELKNLPMEVLRNAQKFVAKRVKEILKKGK